MDGNAKPTNKSSKAKIFSNHLWLWKMGYFRLKRAYKFPSISLAPSSFRFDFFVSFYISFSHTHKHTQPLPFLSILMHFVTIFLFFLSFSSPSFTSFAHVICTARKKRKKKTATCFFTCLKLHLVLNSIAMANMEKNSRKMKRNMPSGERERDERTNKRLRKERRIVWQIQLWCVFSVRRGVYMRPTRLTKTLSTGWWRRNFAFHIFILIPPVSPFLFVNSASAAKAMRQTEKEEINQSNRQKD